MSDWFKQASKEFQVGDIIRNNETKQEGLVINFYSGRYVIEFDSVADNSYKREVKSFPYAYVGDNFTKVRTLKREAVDYTLEGEEADEPAKDIMDIGAPKSKAEIILDEMSPSKGKKDVEKDYAVREKVGEDIQTLLNDIMEKAVATFGERAAEDLIVGGGLEYLRDTAPEEWSEKEKELIEQERTLGREIVAQAKSLFNESKTVQKNVDRLSYIQTQDGKGVFYPALGQLYNYFLGLYTDIHPLKVKPEEDVFIASNVLQEAANFLPEDKLESLSEAIQEGTLEDNSQIRKWLLSHLSAAEIKQWLDTLDTEQPDFHRQIKDWVYGLAMVGPTPSRLPHEPGVRGETLSPFHTLHGPRKEMRYYKENLDVETKERWLDKVKEELPHMADELSQALEGEGILSDEDLDKALDLLETEELEDMEEDDKTQGGEAKVEGSQKLKANLKAVYDVRVGDIFVDASYGKGTVTAVTNLTEGFVSVAFSEDMQIENYDVSKFVEPCYVESKEFPCPIDHAVITSSACLGDLPNTACSFLTFVDDAPTCVYHTVMSIYQEEGKLVKQTAIQREVKKNAVSEQLKQTLATALESAEFKEHDYYKIKQHEEVRVAGRVRKIKSNFCGEVLERNADSSLLVGWEDGTKTLAWEIELEGIAKGE